jgi:hypothetical protein
MGIVSKSGCHHVSDGCASLMISSYLIKSDCPFSEVSHKITRRFCAQPMFQRTLAEYQIAGSGP